MNESNKAPTDASTRPLVPHAAAKMKHHNPDATRAVRDMIDRKRRGGDGHSHP